MTTCSEAHGGVASEVKSGWDDHTRGSCKMALSLSITQIKASPSICFVNQICKTLGIIVSRTGTWHAPNLEVNNRQYSDFSIFPILYRRVCMLLLVKGTVIDSTSN